MMKEGKGGYDDNVSKQRILIKRNYKNESNVDILEKKSTITDTRIFLSFLSIAKRELRYHFIYL